MASLDGIMRAFWKGVMPDNCTVCVHRHTTTEDGQLKYECQLAKPHREIMDKREIPDWCPLEGE